MKILFITFFFPPFKSVAAVRTGKTAKLLHKAGHEIRVISAKNTGLPKELNLEIPKDNLYQTDWFDIDKYVMNIVGINNKSSAKNILHSGQNKSIKSKIVKGMFYIYKKLLYIPDKYFGWYKYAVKKGDDLLDDWEPDIIYASAAPYTGLMIASKLSKKYNIPYVIDLRDLWSDNHNHKQYFIGRYLEYLTLKNASALVSVSKPLVDKLRFKYPNIPCFEIRNAFDEDDFIFENNNVNNKINISYTGMIYPDKQDPSCLFNAISKSQKLKDNISVDFYGNSLDWLISLSKKYEIESVINIHSPIKREEVLRVQSQSDILLLFVWSDKNEKGIFTGKFFEYIGSAKPILAIGDNDDVVSKTIREEGFGLVSNNEQEIVDFILNIRNECSISKITDSYRINKQKFERTHQISKLVNIFENIVNNK